MLATIHNLTSLIYPLCGSEEGLSNEDRPGIDISPSQKGAEPSVVRGRSKRGVARITHHKALIITVDEERVFRGRLLPSLE